MPGPHHSFSVAAPTSKSPVRITAELWPGYVRRIGFAPKRIGRSMDCEPAWNGEAHGLRDAGSGGKTDGTETSYSLFAEVVNSGSTKILNRRHSIRPPAIISVFRPRPAHNAPSFREYGRAELPMKRGCGRTNPALTAVEPLGIHGVSDDGDRKSERL